MAAKLIAEEGLLKGLVLTLDQGNEWVIGRDPDASQLLIEDPSASRKHVLCRLTPEGFVIENLSDTNPVEVNDEIISSPHLLHEGDTVKIGNGQFKFYTDNTAQNEEVPNGNATPEAEMAQIPPESLENNPDLPTQQSEIDDEWDTPHDSIFDEEDEAKHNPQGNDRPNLSSPVSFDLLETGRWLLKVVGGPNQGAEFPMIAGGSYTIGTDPKTCDIVFHDTSVSRQHARITVGEEENLFIEDLNSRNGTLLEGVPLQGKKPLETNTLVTTGTTTFAVYDREGKMQTIISPLLPSIVKVLKDKEQKLAFEEEARKKSEESDQRAKSLEDLQKKLSDSEAHKRSSNLGGFILISIITGLFTIVGIGTLTLFQSEPQQEVKVADIDKQLSQALTPFPDVRYSFNEGSGRLFLVGHVMTQNDKNELLYNLTNVQSIRSIDDSGVIIDELVWREENALLNKNPEWRSVTITSPVAGKFVISGYLKTHKQAEQLYDFVSSSFPYLDRLDRQVVVEEDISNQVSSMLNQVGLIEIKSSFQNGELILTGGVPSGKQEIFQAVMNDFRKIPGVRSVRTTVNQLPQEASMLNISDRYEVTGFSKVGNNLNVVVNGRIVTRGDVLDGMRVTDISPHAIILEKDAVIYRIDY